MLARRVLEIVLQCCSVVSSLPSSCIKAAAVMSHDPIRIRRCHFLTLSLICISDTTVASAERCAAKPGTAADLTTHPYTPAKRWMEKHFAPLLRFRSEVTLIWIPLSHHPCSPLLSVCLHLHFFCFFLPFKPDKV